MNAMIYNAVTLITERFSLRNLRGWRFLAHWVLAILFAACLSPLDGSSDYIGGEIVVSGQISSLPESNIVYVARTSSRARLPEPISGAHIVLYEDGAIAQTIHEDPEVAGKYVLPGFTATPGKTYRIEGHLPDGEKFTSASEQMPLAAGEDEISYTIEPVTFTDGEGTVSERFFINIFTSHRLPSSEEPVFFKWHVEEVYALSPTDFPDPFGNVPPTCYVTQTVDPQRVVLFSSEGTTLTMISDLPLVSREIDASFKERHYFTIYQSSLTRQAHDYWKQVDVVANQSGSIFDTPPAEVKGNITNVENPDARVHGYFQAVNQTIERFYIVPDDLPFRLVEHCEYRAERLYNDYPTECLDCLSVRNSSYNRPAWF